MAKVIKFKKIDNDFNYYVEELTSLFQNDLYSINSIILDKLDSKVPLIKEIASYLILSGGKRLRPLMTSCAYHICNESNISKKNYIGLAAAVEFIHAATLLHDDVVDSSKKRRGSLTANEVWGNKTSVLVGDFLFSRAFQLMSKDGSKEILKLLSDTSVIISEGEVLELSNDKILTINEDIYLEVINAKTASLFSASCQVGAMSTNTSKEKIEALKSFGTNFGISFQLIDDVIDYSSSSKELGKNIGDDFKEGKITMPVILAYLRSNIKEKQFWKKTIQDLKQENSDFNKAYNIIKKYNCIDDTIERANHFARKAVDSLGIFKDSKYKNIFINLVNSSLNRIN